MPRANRHYIPGCVWHITHRCHKQEFLLKFDKDKKCWCHWLYEAKKRYNLCVLNYIVTSNHIHLLVVDTAVDVISKSLQLVAGRTAQEYNIRKKRKGAFWEDRYHATVIQSDEHLVKCMVYIDLDLNMVRAGVVKHPNEYNPSGYNEIQNPPERYRIIDSKANQDYFFIADERKFRQAHRTWVEDALKKDQLQRIRLWSEAIAVGKEDFVKAIHSRLKYKDVVGKVVNWGGMTVLKEPLSAYNTLFSVEKAALSPENTYYLDITYCN